MKKMKIISIIVLLALAFTTLSGCGSDPVKDDLTKYVNDKLPAVQTLETKAIDALNATTGDSYTDDATMFAAVNDVCIPTSVDAITAVKAITPATKEVTALHEQYVAILTAFNSSYVLLADALSAGDAAKAEEANTALTDAQAQKAAFVTALEALAKDHGLKMK